MKDELHGVKTEECIGLKSRMYSVLYGSIEMKGRKKECNKAYKHIISSMLIIDSVYTIIGNEIEDRKQQAVMMQLV